jgi:BASS family bile acid:Na+ symporter
LLIPLQSCLALPVKALAWLGSQGTRAVAALVFIGLAVPPLGEILKPFVTEAIFLLLCVSFMRVDGALLRDQLRRPGTIVVATLWSTVGVPLLFGLGCIVVGLDRHAPDLFLALMLQAVASPMMASPALAALMGLDATLVLVTLVTGTAVVPLTAPLFASAFFGDALKLSPTALGAKLLAILLGALMVAALIRWIFGLAAIQRQKAAIDGFNILILFVFVSAVMGNVAGGMLAHPLLVLEFALVAFAVYFALLGFTTLMFRRLGPERAFAVGLMVSQRNMGLMVAATDGLLPGLTWLYFAMAQFPLYLAPQLLQPIARKLTARPTPTLAAEAADGR